MNLFNINLGDKNSYDKFNYPAGEMQVRLNAETIALVGASGLVIITARITSAEHIIELAMLASAIRSQSPEKSIKLILPYLPYARADRRFVDGDCAGLEVFASLLNSLNLEIFTLDAHSAKSAEKIMRFNDVPAISFIQMALSETRAAAQISNSAPVVEQPSNQAGLILLFPDEGARNRYTKFKVEVNAQILHCSKVRDKKTGKLSGFAVPPKSAFNSTNVLLIDDICDGGGTFLGIADALAEHELELSLYVTHGIFSKGLKSLLARFRKIYTTDSYKAEYQDDRLVVYQTSDVFTDALTSTY